MIRSGSTLSPDNEFYVPTLSSQTCIATPNTLRHPSEAPDFAIAHFAIELVQHPISRILDFEELNGSINGRSDVVIAQRKTLGTIKI